MPKGSKDQHARLLLEESITLRLWLGHLGLQLPPPSTLSDNLNAVSNQTRALIHQVQLRYIFQQSLDDFQKCFVDSTAVEANTERPTDSIILVRLIARVCTAGGHLHRLDLPDMNPIGLLEQQEELRRLSQQIHFLSGKARGEAKPFVSACLVNRCPEGQHAANQDEQFPIDKLIRPLDGK